MTRDTAVVVLLDHSGSMSVAKNGQPAYKIANQGTFALQHCLYGLSGVNAATVAYASRKGTSTMLKLLCDFSEMPYSANFDQQPGGGTPTGQALWYARTVLLQRQEQRKLILLLTDGQPNNKKQTRLATRRCAQDGIDIIALGVNCDAVKEFWECHRIINDIAGLPKAIFPAWEIIVQFDFSAQTQRARCFVT